MNGESCAPTKKYEDYSCYSISDLKEIAQSYNKSHNDQIKISDNKKELVDTLTKKFSNKCKNQRCWLTLDVVKKLKSDSIQKYTFRPDGPKNSFEWLSNIDIQNVIEQYLIKYPEFKFLGAVPIDFDDLEYLDSNFRKLNFENLLKEKKHKVGVVFNTDPSTKSGQHWISLYFDLLKEQVYFFDSVGDAPPKQVRKFISRIVSFIYKKKYDEELDIKKVIKCLKKKDINNDVCKKLNKIDIRYNNIQHQIKDTECGVYSINFVLRLLKGESFDNIKNNITLDEEMSKCRKVYFNSN